MEPKFYTKPSEPENFASFFLNACGIAHFLVHYVNLIPYEINGLTRSNSFKWFWNCWVAVNHHDKCAYQAKKQSAILEKEYQTWAINTKQN